MPDRKPAKIGVGSGNRQCQSPRFTKCGLSVSSCQRAETGEDGVLGRLLHPRSRRFAAKHCFVEPDQADASGPVPFAKIFRFSPDPNHLYIRRHPASSRGAFRDRHGRRGGMRWTRAALLTRALLCGRRSRVVLMPRRWHQVCGTQFPRNDGGKKARSPGRARYKP